MAESVSIDKVAFESRLSNLISTWKDKKLDAFNNVNCLLSVLGKPDDAGQYSKTMALHVSIVALFGIAFWALVLGRG